MSAPARTARLNAYIVLEGNSDSPPWCAMFSTRRSSHGFCAEAPDGTNASAATTSSRMSTAMRTKRAREDSNL